MKAIYLKGASTIITINTNEDIINSVWNGVVSKECSVKHQVIIGLNIARYWLYILSSGGTDPAPTAADDIAFGDSAAILLASGTADAINNITGNFKLNPGDRLKVKIRSGGTAPAAAASKHTVQLNLIN